jgi:hypothetical protein
MTSEVREEADTEEERERERAERGEGVPGVEISLRSSSEPNDRPMSSRVERSVREG